MFSCVLHRITDPQLKLFFSQKLHSCDGVDCTRFFSKLSNALFVQEWWEKWLHFIKRSWSKTTCNSIAYQLVDLCSLFKAFHATRSQEWHRKYQETLHFEAIFDYIWYILDVLFLLPSRPNVDYINYVQLYTILHLYSIVYCKISMLIVLLSAHSYTLYVQVHRLGLGPW